MQCKKKMSRSMLCCNNWQSSILPESISETFSIINSDSAVVCAACSVIVRLSLAVNEMMNKLTIKLAGRQAQGVDIFPSFHGSSKEKARQRNSCSSYLGKLSGRCWISGKKRVEKEAPCIHWNACHDVGKIYCDTSQLLFLEVIQPMHQCMKYHIKWYRPIATKRVPYLF